MDYSENAVSTRQTVEGESADGVVRLDYWQVSDTLSVTFADGRRYSTSLDPVSWWTLHTIFRQGRAVDGYVRAWGGARRLGLTADGQVLRDSDGNPVWY